MTAWRGSAGTTPSGAGVLRRPALGSARSRVLGRRDAGRGPRRSARRARSRASAASPGATGNTAVGRAGRGPHDREAAEVRIHHDADRPGVAERRDAADGEARQLPGLVRGRAPHLGLAGHGRQAGEVHAVGTRDQAQDRLERAASAGRHEDQRLDDLAELGVDRPGGVLRRCGSTRRTPARRGSRPCGRRRRRRAGSGADRGLGHGGESTDGRPRPRRGRVGSRS